ncbi:MAG: hypothetical protein IPK15_27235 [Verrucomicrobia bacterium]|nr:hypothetical protein [Verrucomicrobiota bacterium]
MKFPLRLLVAAIFMIAPLTIHAQWTQQTITLRAGWNAVFLNVLPEPADCDSLFAGLPVESVWDFNPTVDSPQFVQDPSTLIPGLPNWLTWFPPASPQGGVRNLFLLRDARGYLIKVADGSAPISWTITGRPSLRPLTWRPGVRTSWAFGWERTRRRFRRSSPVNLDWWDNRFTPWELPAHGSWSEVWPPRDRSLGARIGCAARRQRAARRRSKSIPDRAWELSFEMASTKRPQTFGTPAALREAISCACRLPPIRRRANRRSLARSARILEGVLLDDSDWPGTVSGHAWVSRQFRRMASNWCVSECVDHRELLL